MKSAMQEDPDEVGPDGTKRVKSNKDLSPEERSKKEAKDRKEAIEVNPNPFVSRWSNFAKH